MLGGIKTGKFNWERDVTNHEIDFQIWCFGCVRHNLRLCFAWLEVKDFEPRKYFPWKAIFVQIWCLDANLKLFSNYDETCVHSKTICTMSSLTMITTEVKNLTSNNDVYFLCLLKRNQKLGLQRGIDRKIGNWWWEYVK